MLADPVERPRREQRRDHLLDAAQRVFAEHGFRATTMEEIARAAGFTKPILYQHFTSKADLYREVVARLTDRLLARLSAAVGASAGPREKLERAFDVFFATVVEETDAFRILFVHPHEGATAAELRRLEAGLVSFLEPHIDVSISDEHRRQLAAGVVGIAEGVALTWIIQQRATGWPSPDPGESARLAARAATLAWGGLRAVQGD